MNYLAIDVGGTFIKYAVITENCSILEKDKTPTKQDSLEIFIQSLTDICDRIKGQYEIEGIALSMPGIIDSKKGFMYTGGSLFCISNVNIVEILEKKSRDSGNCGKRCQMCSLGRNLAGIFKGLPECYRCCLRNSSRRCRDR